MIVQVVLEGEIEVGQRLRLDALGGVDEQHRALAGSEGARHLIGEVDVAGRVDHVQDVYDLAVPAPVLPTPTAAGPPGS